MAKFPENDRPIVPSRIVPSLLPVVFAVPLIALAYLGSFSRFLADDYCTYATLVEHGFFGSQVHWYLNWSGRYSATFLTNLTQAIGVLFTPVMVSLVIPIWFVTLVGSLRSILRAIFSRQSRAQTLLASTLILLATANGAPDLYQSVLWHTGLVTYAIPLMIGTAYAAWIMRSIVQETARAAGGTRLVFSTVVAFVLGGFSETYLFMQTAALFALIAASLVPGWRSGLSRSRPIVLTGLAGSILAMLVLASAPGNAIRLSLMPAPAPLGWVIVWSIRHSFAFVANSVLRAPVTFLAIFSLPALSAAILNWNSMQRESPVFGIRKLQHPLVIIPVAAFLLILASIMPAVYATSAYPAERSLITAQYVLVFSVCLWSFVCGSMVSARWQSLTNKSKLTQILLAAAILAIALPATLVTVRQIWGWIPDAQGFAEAWDKRDAALRSARASGVRRLEVASLVHMGGLAEIGSDPDEWINNCIADSYGLDAVTAKQ